jgi:hypothetical protein
VPWRGVPYAAVDLSVFEAKALALALTEHGHSVSERTVQRWKSGTTKPKPQDIDAIRRLVGATEKEPPWVGRLQQTVDSIHARQDEIMDRQAEIADSASRKLIEALGSPELLEWAQRIGERTAVPPSQSDEGSGGRSGGAAPGTRVLRDQEPS